MKLKRCSKCRIEKPTSSFHKSKSRKDGFNPWCKECKKKRQKERREEEGPSPRHNIYYHKKGYKTVAKRLYGESVDFDKMYRKQKGRCAICKTHQSELSKRLNIDHNHETGQVRSLLCHSCNVGLGFFRHCKGLMQDAINYLARYEI